MRFDVLRPACTLASLALLSLIGCHTRAGEVDELVEAQMRRQHIPGLAIAVVRDGKLISAEGFGLADVESGTPVRPDTVFQLASITKQFTAMGILLLVQDGKLGLDDLVSLHLHGTPASWQRITVRHLLTHTSGLKDFINEPTASLGLEMTEQQVLDAHNKAVNLITY